MIYDFSDLYKGQNEIILEDFIDKYTACIHYTAGQKPPLTPEYYKNILEILAASFHEDKLLCSFEELAHYKLSCGIPYVILINEIYGLQTILIAKMSQHTTHGKVVELLALIKKISNRVAHIYLDNYIDKLISLNNIRISSIADLFEKNIISHYESHLIWLSELAASIQKAQTEDFVQLDHTLCDFGLWLHGKGKKIIQNNSKYKSLENLHMNLHLFAQKIHDYIDEKEYHILINYLEKCELISLGIGTELALIDNILMNKRITKDALTGALNRQALKNIFESQYELSLATSTPFILAMCDLDYFKVINDTYGHIAGDKVLELFVQVVKKNIRNSDIIIRYGGEEFIIMLPTIHKEKGIAILETIRKEFQEMPLTIANATIHATVSIGMMEITPEFLYKKSFQEEYLAMVDKALYSAKENGRNQVVSVWP
ncbi:MAG: sensor domain-containing diguanylate cyclase [Sulfurimonas sp.]|nr:sensor domain-containing diguanylate cyclase [Sulfurimonas sp.]